MAQIHGKQIRTNTLSQDNLNLTSPLYGSDAATKDYVLLNISTEVYSSSNKNMIPNTSIGITNSYIRVGIKAIQDIKNLDSTTEVFLNTVKVDVGPLLEFQFRSPIGDIRNIGESQQGDFLYVNTDLLGFEITTDDIFDYNYVSVDNAIITPTFSSSNTVVTIEGTSLTYSATSDTQGLNFIITDDNDTGALLDFDTGVLTADSPDLGTYNLVLYGANVFGKSEPFDLRWIVSGGSGSVYFNRIAPDVALLNPTASIMMVESLDDSYEERDYQFAGYGKAHKVNSNLILSGMSNTNYNQTYDFTGFGGRWWDSDDEFDTGLDFYAVYAYDTGSVWYVAIQDKSIGSWVVLETNVDPYTWVDTTVINATNSETFTSATYENYTDKDNVLFRRPVSSDSNVDYTHDWQLDMSDSDFSDSTNYSMWFSSSHNSLMVYSESTSLAINIFIGFNTTLELNDIVDNLPLDYVTIAEGTSYLNQGFDRIVDGKTYPAGGQSIVNYGTLKYLELQGDSSLADFLLDDLFAEWSFGFTMTEDWRVEGGGPQMFVDQTPAGNNGNFGWGLVYNSSGDLNTRIISSYSGGDTQQTSTYDYYPGGSIQSWSNVFSVADLPKKNDLVSFEYYNTNFTGVIYVYVNGVIKGIIPEGNMLSNNTSSPTRTFTWGKPKYISNVGDTYYPQIASYWSMGIKDLWISATSSLGVTAMSDLYNNVNDITQSTYYSDITHHWDLKLNLNNNKGGIDLTVEDDSGPTDIALEQATLTSNTATGSIAGTLSSTSFLSDTYTYSFVSGVGDTNNNDYYILGDNLYTNNTLGIGVNNIRVETTSLTNDLSYVESLTITVIDPTPTDITLTNNTFYSVAEIGDVIGTFSTTDADSISHTYSLVSGTGSEHNGNYTINGENLLVGTAMDVDYSQLFVDNASSDNGLYIRQTKLAFDVDTIASLNAEFSVANYYYFVKSNDTERALIYSIQDSDWLIVYRSGYDFTTAIAGEVFSSYNSATVFNNEVEEVGGVLYPGQDFFFKLSANSIRVRTTDGDGNYYEENMYVQILDSTPSDIQLSNNVINDLYLDGDLVGTLSTTDDDSASFTYSLISGTGDSNNSEYSISGNQLLVATNSLILGTNSVRIQTEDSDGLTYEESFDIQVKNATEILTENWELGNLGFWAITSASPSNVTEWTVGSASQRRNGSGTLVSYSAYEGTYSAYTSIDNGDTADYDGGNSNVIHLYRTVSIPATYSSVDLDFKWIGEGEGSSFDYMRVYVVPTTQPVPSAGSQQSTTYNILGSTNRYNGASSWQSESVDVTSLISPSTDYRIVFEFRNDGSVTRGAFAVDDIKLVSII